MGTGNEQMGETAARTPTQSSALAADLQQEAEAGMQNTKPRLHGGLPKVAGAVGLFSQQGWLEPFITKTEVQA